MDIKIGFGGGCHWCTEAVYQAISGVTKVSQGWISSEGKYSTRSEAVLVSFDDNQVTVAELIKVHLSTHSSSSKHSMREKYRSAIYYLNKSQIKTIEQSIISFNTVMNTNVITLVLPMIKFTLNEEKYLNYYEKNKGNQFCERYIEPKLNKTLKTLK